MSHRNIDAGHFPKKGMDSIINTRKQAYKNGCIVRMKTERK